MWRTWEELPEFMQCEEVRPYYEALDKKKASLKIKRLFDAVAASILLAILAVPMLIISIWIKLDSKGPVFYRQERVTQYGRVFLIHKFRTMVVNADQIGSAVTVGEDPRITKVGHVIRKYRLDEFPQLIDVLQGNMSFVGTRPEAVKYVREYSPEMNATLLLPAGITSEASIRYKNEEKLLSDTDDVDNTYLTKILPEKMIINTTAIMGFSLYKEILVLLRTIIAVSDMS